MRLHVDLVSYQVSAEWPARGGPARQEVKALTGEQVEVRFHRDGVAERLAVDTPMALRVRATKGGALLAELTTFTRPGADTGYYTGRLDLNTDAVVALLAASTTRNVFQALAAVEWTLPGEDNAEESDDVLLSLQRRTGGAAGDPLVLLTPWSWLKLRLPEANGFEHDDEAEEISVGPPSGGAGGVLSGSYPNPGFAVDMATQAELNAVAAAKLDIDGLAAAFDALIAVDGKLTLPSGRNIIFNDA